MIIGAGSMGLSAGYYLAKRGVKTLLLDRFHPPHTSGSHHGDTRLIRHAYPGSPTYTAMALRADRLWKELEEASGESLLVRSGVLNLGPAQQESLAEKQQRASQFGVRAELLRPDEVRNRWPGLTIPDSYVGLFEPEAGCLRSEACISAYRRRADC